MTSDRRDPEKPPVPAKHQKPPGPGEAPAKEPNYSPKSGGKQEDKKQTTLPDPHPPIQSPS